MEKDLIKRKAIYVLNKLGGVKENNCIDDYRESTSVWRTFEMEGLKICSNELSSIDSPENQKKHVEDVSIDYDDEYVFNSETGRYIPGFWEELLQAIYEKTPKIVEKRRLEAIELEELIRKGTEFFDKYILDINRDVKIDNDIEIKNIEHLSTSWKEPPYKEKNVLYKNNIVLHATNEGTYNTFYVYKYVPGEWEEDIIEYCKREEEERRLRKKKTDEKRLQLIRNI